MLLAVLLLLTCVVITAPTVYAAGKATESRAIAIVFDNSGSMYQSSNQAWCRATYAMEVFASMLNDGDILQIYPMWPITVGDKEYSMDVPLQITDAADASIIREIFTPCANGTPIESIDCAAAGIKTVDADKKYVIVLTDGGSFSKNGNSLTKERTVTELDKRVNEYAGPSLPFMYLGIGAEACVPSVQESEWFVKRQVINTEDVLSTLTLMCNLVFGRDTLPKSHISGNTIDFDISMKKLIVFVQGENISDVTLTGNGVGHVVNSQQTMYSTRGAGDYYSYPDSSLQGMIITYADCLAGTYEIEYTGTARSVEIYYEPDADLDFVFTDPSGNTIPATGLFEGDYKVSFGLKDAKTGELIASDLLGNPQYHGSYFINGQDYPISHEGFSGSVNVPLEMDETFEATLTVTYLSGYTITKDSTDFGWPEGGIVVSSRAPVELTLEITGGAEEYELATLPGSTPYIAKVYSQGVQLTDSELERVELKWEPETSNADIRKSFAGDHWELHLGYKDPAAPQDTVCGECTVTIYAHYSAPGRSESVAEAPLTYNIQDTPAQLQVDLRSLATYFVIGDLKDSKPLTVEVKLHGETMSDESFAATQLLVDCGGIEHTVTSNPENKSFSVRLLPTEGIASGDYTIGVKAIYTDPIGRETQAEDHLNIKLGYTSQLVRWGIRLLLLLLLAFITWLIMRIKVLPTKAHTTKRLSSMNFDGEDVSKSAAFLADIKKGSARTQAQYGGKKFGLMMDVSPGAESYLYKSQKGRSAEVKPSSVRKFGPAKIQEALIGTAKYVADDSTGKLVPALPNQKPFTLKNGVTVRYSGTISDAGIDKDFEVLTKINFNKKK